MGRGNVAVAAAAPVLAEEEETRGRRRDFSYSSSSSESSVSESEERLSKTPKEQDLCGFRLFQRPSSLLIHVDNQDEEAHEQGEFSTLSALSCWEKQSPPLEENNHNNDRALFKSFEPLFCAPSSTAAAATGSSTSTPSLLSLAPSFSWLQDSTTSSSSPNNNHKQAHYTAAECANYSDTTVTPASDMRRPRHVSVVTTAALPWMTGTAVNPALRAAALWQRYHAASCRDDREQEDGIFYDAAAYEQEVVTATTSTTTSSSSSNNNNNIHTDENWSVTLVIPWLERAADRVELYGAAWEHATPAVQEAYIRTWWRDAAGHAAAADGVRLVWYRARYYHPYRSIFSSEDICAVLQTQVPGGSAGERDDNANCPVCILEEPEHLLLYRTMNQKPDTAHPLQGFYTIGVLHTNYKSYAAQGALGLISEMVAASLCATVAAAYTDKLIKLSATLQAYAPHKETCCNVHGIRQDFLDKCAPTGNDIYFIGKLLWAKGLDKLLAFQRVYYRQTGGQYFAMDIYGSGPDQDEIETAFLRRRRRKPIPAKFCGRVDHAAIGSQYKIFVNPSITEVLCTVSIHEFNQY